MQVLTRFTPPDSKCRWKKWWSWSLGNIMMPWSPKMNGSSDLSISISQSGWWSMTDCCLGLVLLSGSAGYLNKIMHQSCLDSALILVHAVVSMNMLTDLSGLKTTLSDSQMVTDVTGTFQQWVFHPTFGVPALYRPGSTVLFQEVLHYEKHAWSLRMQRGALGKLLQEHRLLQEKLRSDPRASSHCVRSKGLFWVRKLGYHI